MSTQRKCVVQQTIMFRTAYYHYSFSMCTVHSMLFIHFFYFYFICQNVQPQDTTWDKECYNHGIALNLTFFYFQLRKERDTICAVIFNTKFSSIFKISLIFKMTFFKQNGITNAKWHFFSEMATQLDATCWIKHATQDNNIGLYEMYIITLLKIKSSLLPLMVPWRIFPFHKRFFNSSSYY